MKKHQWLGGLILMAALAALAVWARNRIHFDFAVFRVQIARANWGRIAIGVVCIYAGYLFRAPRWALLLRHNKKVPLFSLLGTQVIGFTAVALIGRIADPVRPYLVSKRTALPLSEQIAVYIVERLFDIGTMALIFSVAMIWVPSDEILRVTAHSGLLARLAAHERGAAVVLARFGGLFLTFCGVVFLVAIRWWGEAVALFLERGFSLLSKNLGRAVGSKVRTFHKGLDVIRSFSDFAIAATLSIAMWLLIAYSYFTVCKAFTASPELAGITPPQCVLLMIASGGASILQLPVLGWFSQIGLVVIALTAVFGANPEAATACAATLLLVSFLSVIPVGLAWAQFEHVSLRRVTAESEQAEGKAEQELEAQDGANANAAP